jgi:hypothetical protein
LGQGVRQFYCGRVFKDGRVTTSLPDWQNDGHRADEPSHPKRLCYRSRDAGLHRDDLSGHLHRAPPRPRSSASMLNAVRPIPTSNTSRPGAPLAYLALDLQARFARHQPELLRRSPIHRPTHATGLSVAPVLTGGGYLREAVVWHEKYLDN